MPTTITMDISQFQTWLDAVPRKYNTDKTIGEYSERKFGLRWIGIPKFMGGADSFLITNEEKYVEFLLRYS